MSINKILFGVIGVLFLAIFGVGIFALQNPSTVSDDTPVPIVSDTPSPQVGNSVPSEVAGIPTVIPSKKPSEYRIQEVAMHNSLKSCYTAVNGSVYDLTSFIDQHPGGVQTIESLCGIDGTATFQAQHEGQRRPENELASLKIGVLIQ